MREQQLAARTTVRRQRDAALRDVQPQRPGRLDAVEIDERALLQHGEITGLGDLPDDALQYEAALRRGAVTAQHVEGKARQALADEVGAPARLAAEKARLLEEIGRGSCRGRV